MLLAILIPVGIAIVVVVAVSAVLLLRDRRNVPFWLLDERDIRRFPNEVEKWMKEHHGT